jgi:hypothetical protein
MTGPELEGEWTMTRQTITAASAALPGASCDPATRITRTLLAYGIIAGPIFILVSLAQALSGTDSTSRVISGAC